MGSLRHVDRSCWTICRCSPYAFPLLSLELLVLAASPLLLEHASAALLLLELVVFNLGSTSFVYFSLDCFVLIFLNALLRCFRFHGASQLLFNPLSAVFFVLLSRRPSPPDQRHAPGTARFEPNTSESSRYVHSLRYRHMFFHRQLPCSPCPSS